MGVSVVLTSSYIGASLLESGVDVDFDLFFLCTNNPVSTPHVYNRTPTTNAIDDVPTTAAVFRISRASDDVLQTVAKNHNSCSRD